MAITGALLAWLTHSSTTTRSVTHEFVTWTNTSTTSSTLTTTTATFTSATTTTISTTTTDAWNLVTGLWNTTAAGNGLQAMAGSNAGNYPSGESPDQAFDQNCSTKYLNYGHCPSSFSSLTCGINTGFHVTLSGPTIIRSLQFCTANDHVPRDPLTMTLEGSNQTGSALFLGSSWTLIYNGSTGLTVNPGRNAIGVMQTFSNSIAFLSYRVLMTSKRGSANSIQYSEVYLFP